MFKLAFLSTIVAVAMAAYQFQDSDFNRLLYDNLTADLREEMEPLRLKRSNSQNIKHMDCKPKSKSTEEKKGHCCNEEMPKEKEPDELKKIKDICIKETLANEKSAGPMSCDNVLALKQATACTAECISKKFGLLEENEQFNRTALLNYTRTMVGSNKWKSDVVEQYVDGCLNELSVAKDGNKIAESKSSTCKSNALDFQYCTWRKFVQGCPANLRIQSKKCKKLRSRLANDDNSYLHKFYKIFF